MKKLAMNTQKEIEFLCEQGDFHYRNKEYAKAITFFWRAYDCLPEPKEEWVAGTWILGAIGDSNFMNRDYQSGITNLSVAINHFPYANENPFLHLRLGQCYFELNQFEKATYEFTVVCAIDGEDLFRLEDEKYRGCINRTILPEFIYE